MSLPYCMMPDGDEPCQAYREQMAEIERLRSDIETAKNFIGQYVNLPGHEHAALQALVALENPPERCPDCGSELVPELRTCTGCNWPHDQISSTETPENGND